MATSAWGRSEPDSADEFLFGDPLLHARLLTAGELVACLMQAAPTALSTAALAEHIGQPLAQVQVQTLLEGLQRTGLIHRDETHGNAWYRHPQGETVTLAEIFLSMSRLATTPASDGGMPGTPTRSLHQQIDMLLGQATMSVNQLVVRQLRQFDLGRHLTAVASTQRHRAPLTEQVGD